MPIQTWRSYASKIRKKPKSDVREYLRATPLWVSRKAKHCDSLQQSREVEQKEKEEEINEKAIFISDTCNDLDSRLQLPQHEISPQTMPLQSCEGNSEASEGRVILSAKNKRKRRKRIA
jgi:hypothetical protein